MLSLRDPQKTLPARPLRLRPEPVTVGESVYLIGCSYTEANCAQNVYRGRVTERFRGDKWRFDLDPPVELPGFSGAPIIDLQGAVVGVMTVYFEPRQAGAKWLEAGGQDVGPIFGAVDALR